MNQSQRDRVMAKFRNGSIEILIATDVAARGIDVNDIDMVFNYDIPKDDEDYVHRIGRTGRAGKMGKAYSFVSGKDIYKLRDIQRYAKVIIKRKSVPSLTDVENIKATIMIDKIKETLKEKDLEKYARMAESLISDQNTSLDVAAALLKMMFAFEKKEQKQEVDIFQDVTNVNSHHSNIKTRRNRTTELFINIGKKDNVKTGDFVGAITGEAGISGDLIGNIKILETFSFVEVPAKYTSTIISALHSSNIKGKKVSVQLANKSPSNRKIYSSFKNS
jgi:ATP-dependent RNA helicase DeaD